MYKSASERIFDLQVRLASLRQVIASEDVVDPTRLSKPLYVADQIERALLRAPQVKVRSEGTAYSSFTGAQFKKAMVAEIIASAEKHKKLLLAQNERVAKKIEELKNKKGMTKRDRDFEIRVQEGMIATPKDFARAEAEVSEFKKIKVQKSGGYFIVSK